ncbi:hypothetical protein [Pseudodonghicola flavimaris]|uniref:Uncharacterized protein n=1 Tax=Pseudodonghicola flavimaris TaxID=3050036 RepID=A0ABT7EZ55_9RHOB|nr:hypothetical protein [Pseudodonghicola flavimaris]MDK3017620.1 hypothetical protein [Pseudodonghicola flavimaris]
MKIKILVSCAGPAGSFAANQEPTVADAVGADLIRAGYAELLDAEVQPAAAATDPAAAPATDPAAAG